MNLKQYLNATQEAGKAFYLRGLQGPVVMLNLLKFKNIADYTATPELAPESQISGIEAYKLYMDHTLPFLKEVEGEILFQGEGGSYLIGPEMESWDQVLLVRHQSAEVFLQFAQNEEYLKGVGHRTAALHDSRLLPIIESTD